MRNEGVPKYNGFPTNSQWRKQQQEQRKTKNKE